MKLKAYDVKITLADPDEPETQITVTLLNVPREKILTVRVPLAGTLQQFEESVH